MLHRDVLAILKVGVDLGQTKITKKKIIAAVTNTHSEIVGFDVSMDEKFRVSPFNGAQHLIGY